MGNTVGVEDILTV